MAVATNVELPTKIVRRIVDSSTGIPLGTLMKFSGDNTAAANAADGDAFAGIAVEEKVATETDIVDIGCALDGAWDIDTTAAAINAGDFVALGASQAVALTVGTADLVDGSLCGRAETTRDGGNRIRVRLMGV